jgi:hypothetical protein
MSHISDIKPSKKGATSKDIAKTSKAELKKVKTIEMQQKNYNKWLKSSQRYEKKVITERNKQTKYQNKIVSLQNQISKQKVLINKSSTKETRFTQDVRKFKTKAQQYK